MVDQVVLISMHCLLALAAWLILMRPELDNDPVTDGQGGTEPTSDA